MLIAQQSAARDGKQRGGFSTSVPRIKSGGNSLLVARAAMSPDLCFPFLAECGSLAVKKRGEKGDVQKGFFCLLAISCGQWQAGPWGVQDPPSAHPYFFQYHPGNVTILFDLPGEQDYAWEQTECRILSEVTN